jgi:hypothetical protein
MRAPTFGRSSASLDGNAIPGSSPAAFMLVARDRQALARRLAQGGRSHPDRYRDLLSIMGMIRLQYAQLAGRLGWDDTRLDLHDLPSAVDGEEPVADWARPWGISTMAELRASHELYARQRDRLGRQLSAWARASAAAEAHSYLGDLADRLGIGQGLIEDQSAPPRTTGFLLEGSNGASAADRPETVGISRLVSATVGTAACLAVAIGALSLGAFSGGAPDPTITPRAVANVPERPLPALVDSSNEPRRAGHQAPKHHARHRETAPATPAENAGGGGKSKAHERSPRDASAPEPTPPTSQPIPTTAPAPTPTAPPPTPTTTAPAPTPTSPPRSGPDPVQSLPQPKPQPAPAPPPPPSDPELSPASP